MTSLLFDMGALDPLTYSAVVGVVAFVSFIACYLPARRALKIDPAITLRME